MGDGQGNTGAGDGCVKPRANLRAGWCAAALLAGAAALASCSSQGDGPGAILVDPGHYNAYHCNDLATRWKALLTREGELRGLMEKAGEGAGGTVIGSLAYRSDYETVLTEERLVRRAAFEKKCPFAADYQSDRTIR
jgi:hypothetical protein